MTTTKPRSDLQRAFLKAVGLAFVAAFVVADTAAAIDAQQEPIKKLTQPHDPSPNRPGSEKSETGVLVRKFAEMLASGRDDKDRVIEVSATGTLLRSTIGSSNKEASAKPFQYRG